MGVTTGLFGVTYGIMASIGSSIGVLLVEQARPKVSVLGYIRGTDTFRDAAVYPQAKRIPGIKIFQLNASLHFANSDHFESKMQDTINHDSMMGMETHSVLIDAGTVNQVDTTAVAMLQKFNDSLRRRGIQMSFARWQTPCVALLRAAGFHLNGVPEERWFLSIHDAVLAAHTRQKHALAGAMTVELYVDSPSPIFIPDIATPKSAAEKEKRQAHVNEEKACIELNLEKRRSEVMDRAKAQSWSSLKALQTEYARLLRNQRLRMNNDPTVKLKVIQKRLED